MIMTPVKAAQQLQIALVLLVYLDASTAKQTCQMIFLSCTHPQMIGQPSRRAKLKQGDCWFTHTKLQIVNSVETCTCNRWVRLNARMDGFRPR